MKTSLILLSGGLWLFYEVCFFTLLNPLLTFLPPLLEYLGRTDHDKWYVHLPAELLGLIVCVTQSLLLLWQIRSGNRSPRAIQRTRIIWCTVSILEAVAFLALIGFFFRNKRLYEDLPVVFLLVL